MQQLKNFFRKIGRWLLYIFEFMHSPFTVIAKEVEGKVDYSIDDGRSEEKHNDG